MIAARSSRRGGAYLVAAIATIMLTVGWPLVDTSWQVWRAQAELDALQHALDEVGSGEALGLLDPGAALPAASPEDASQQASRRLISALTGLVQPPRVREGELTSGGFEEMGRVSIAVDVIGDPIDLDRTITALDRSGYSRVGRLRISLDSPDQLQVSAVLLWPWVGPEAAERLATLAPLASPISIDNGVSTQSLWAARSPLDPEHKPYVRSSPPPPPPVPELLGIYSAQGIRVATLRIDGVDVDVQLGATTRAGVIEEIGPDYVVVRGAERRRVGLFE
ncbi:hypothetical protein [Maricaulis sp.]|uniref:hypothetical protein n=1 Tax=Maricaulis sp. TaxID=1486257 RepID=UPI00260ECA54|nr:hypothetical protein [Maricaulis sp.]